MNPWPWILLGTYIALGTVITLRARTDGRRWMISLLYGILWPRLIFHVLIPTRAYRRTLPPDHPDALPRRAR